MWRNTKYFIPPIAVLALLCLGTFLFAHPAKAATILITNSSDTLTTFRTNVNTSLTNLNAALFSYPFPSNATSTSIAFNGGLTASTLSVGTLSGILKAASGAVSAATNGTDYTLVSAQSCTNQVVTALTASGGSTCSTVSNAMLANSTISGIALGGTLAALTATNGTLTFSGSYDGGTARTIGLNLANGNTWSVLQQFALASSTQFSAASQTFYIDSTGHVLAKDTVNNWSGVLSPTHSFVLPTATTTTWTASTTNSAYSPWLIMPFAGTLRQVRCATDASFVGVNVQVNGSNAAPSYFVASTTVGKVSFTSANTFTAGQKILANFGTTTTASTKAVSCTFDVTES